MLENNLKEMAKRSSFYSVFLINIEKMFHHTSNVIKIYVFKVNQGKCIITTNTVLKMNWLRPKPLLK